MKQWWQNLALREKQAVLIGAVAAGLFLIYALIWSPLINKVDSLRTDIPKQQRLLAWMEEANKQMSLITPTSQESIRKKSFTSTAALLAWVQTSINKSSLSKSLAQLKGRSGDSIELQLQNANFDQLMTWLMTAQAQQHFKIVQLSVTKGQTPGIVQATLILRAS